MTRPFTIDFINRILAKHPSECVFELDAPTKILQRMNERGLNDQNLLHHYTDVEILDAWRSCWHESEIYCPHEGINRLAECGVTSLDWELAK